MRVLRWLVFSILTIAFSTATLTRNEKLTLEIDEEEDARSTITFEPVSYYKSLNESNFII